jgi:hypothetical protein
MLGGRDVREIMPALMRITLISLLTNMGDFLGDMVTDVKEASGVSGNPMQAFGGHQAKFGVDPTADFGRYHQVAKLAPQAASIAGTI